MAKLGRRLPDLSVERQHELRIRVKKLRYACHFFAGLFGRKRAKPFTSALGGLQDVLGRLNDVATARGLLAALPGGETPEEVPAGDEARRAAHLRAGGLVLGWQAHAAATDRRDLQERWDRFAAMQSFWKRPADSTPVE